MAEGRRPGTVTVAQVRALAHPTRVRIWAALGSRDRTISQLAHALRLNKGSVSHHLSSLLSAGLVRPGPTRTVRGGVERYYTRVVDRVLMPHDRGEGAATRAMLTELMQRIEAADAPHLHQRTLRLTPPQAEALVRHLDELVDRLPPADERHPRYSVVTAVFRSTDG